MVQYVAVLPTSIMTPGCPATGGLCSFLQFFVCPLINRHHGLSGSGILGTMPNICPQRFTVSPSSLGFHSAFRSPRASLSLLTEFLSSCQPSFFAHSPSAQSRSPLSPFVYVSICARESVSTLLTKHPQIQRSRKKCKFPVSVWRDRQVKIERVTFHVQF